MTDSPSPTTRRPTAWIALSVLASLGLLAAGYGFWTTERALAAATERLDATERTLSELLGEVTRMRIEQSAEGQGAAALLERLAQFAPMTSNARITEPDYQNAKKELRATVRAFESLGEAAWKPVVDRIATCDPKQDFDELKWLLEIATRLDPPAGKQILTDVLLGQRLPYPRLRWWAAELLIDHDKPLARTLLRRILLSESAHGVDMNRASQYGMTIPDKAAYATTGFNNFVQLYLRTEDPETSDTLLMVIGRIEHDKITLKDCIVELGRLRCQRAVKQIKKLYDDPPLGQQDFFFLGHCAQAIADIEGPAAIPWLEQKLKQAQIDVNANRLQSILDGLR